MVNKGIAKKTKNGLLYCKLLKRKFDKENDDLKSAVKASQKHNLSKDTFLNLLGGKIKPEEIKKEDRIKMIKISIDYYTNKIIVIKKKIENYRNKIHKLKNNKEKDKYKKNKNKNTKEKEDKDKKQKKIKYYRTQIFHNTNLINNLMNKVKLDKQYLKNVNT